MHLPGPEASCLRALATPLEESSVAWRVEVMTSLLVGKWWHNPMITMGNPVRDLIHLGFLPVANYRDVYRIIGIIVYNGFKRA